MDRWQTSLLGISEQLQEHRLVLDSSSLMAAWATRRAENKQMSRVWHLVMSLETNSKHVARVLMPKASSHPSPLPVSMH